MRITAPMFACPLLRPFSVRGDQRLGVSVASAWTLAGAPLPVTELWKRFQRAAGPDEVLDQGLPKSASEWLLVGHAHPPGPVFETVVGVEAAHGYKAVSVIGDRIWRRGVPTEPELFTKMPLDWSRAFGGEGFESNPLGRGFIKGDSEGVPLPNVETHGRLIDSPSDRPSPAGFRPFGIEWPQRTRRLGTYGRSWFEEDYPGFAEDIDWRVHSIAPEDQRQESELTPGQRFVLHNLVEGQPRVEIELPRVSARCFTYRDPEVPSLSEVPLTTRTVWFVPDEDMLILIAAGSQVVSSPLLSDLSGILVGLDWSELPRDAEHWGEALASRLDRSEGSVVELLDDAPLMPDGMHFPDLDEQAEDLTLPGHARTLEANLYEGAKRRREAALQLFAEAGFEGGEELFPMPHPPGQLSKEPIGERVRGALEDARREEQKAREKMAEIRADAQAELEKLGIDASFLDAKREPGPPPILASAQIAFLEEASRKGKAMGLPTDVFEGRLNDPAFHRQLLEKERRGREGYRLMAHREEQRPPEPNEDRRQELREQVERAIRDRESLSEQDLTCADLNELDLSGMDLRGAWLEGAELAKANLSGALLERAVLAKADLSEAVLYRTVLRHTNLGRTRLLFTELRDCDLGEAILAHANLRAASFTGCDLRQVDLSEAWFEQTRFQACNLEDVTLIKVSLNGVEFTESRLTKANLIEVDLSGVSFHRCDLSEAALVTCRGEGVRFDDANLESARLVVGCEFRSADFRGANISRGALRGCSFEGAFFDGADLRGADLSQANCTRASFVKADMRKLLATECHLEEAVLRGANLMEAVLQGSDLRGADLAQTNLFGADLALIRGDDRTTLAGALTTRMRIRPLRKGEPAAEGATDGG